MKPYIGNLGSDTVKSTLSEDAKVLNDWYQEKGVKAHEYYLAVGRFVPENNFETMVSEFMKSNTKKDFVLITNVENNSFYESLLKSTHFDQDKRIKFVGTVYDKELLKKLRENAYGYLKSEKGVHRLVRISPFNAAGKRQTSFVSCDVMPDIEEDVDIEVKDEDIRIDTFRSSGAGGQHINKTSSAIRITHFPTGIVVQCQNERSQFQNKDKAMQMLKAKLYLLEQQKNAEKLSGIRGEVTEIGWGNQIRSYVMQPYTLVKDHRTSEEVSNVGAVMDGNIDPFINAYLKWINTKPEEDA